MPHDLRDTPAQAILERYDQTSVQQMARARGIEVKTQSKAKLLPQLVSRLFDPQLIDAALKELEPQEQAALDQLVLLGGLASTYALRGRLEEEGVVDPAERSQYGQIQIRRGSPTSRSSRAFEDIVARLGARGLVFTAITQGYKSTLSLGIPAPTIFIPNPVLRTLPAAHIPVETAVSPAHERPSQLSALLRDLYVLLSAAREEPLSIISSGDLAKKAITRLDRQFRVSENAASVRSESELGRLPLLRTLAQELNLLVFRQGTLEPGDEVGPFLSLPRGQRLRRIFDAYQKTTQWSELTRLGIPVWPRTQLNHPMVAAARQRVLREIAALTAGEWISLEHLVDRIRRQAFELLLPRSWDSASYWYGTTYYYEPYPYAGANPLGLHFGRTQSEEYSEASSFDIGWDQVEAVLVREIVVEPLWWLGVVDLGSVDAESAPVAFRVTPEGAMVLRGKAPAIQDAAPHVVIQPNFQIFAFEPTGEDVLYRLDLVARRVRSEQAVEYHLSRESVYAAQQSGMETEDILDFLEQISSVPIPQNVRRSIEDWGAQHSRIVLRRHVGLVHGVDEAAIDTLYADPELTGLLGRRVSPTACLVPRDHLVPVRDYLIEGGPDRAFPLPAITAGSSLGVVPLVSVDPGGDITFRERLPSIFLRELIDPFTDGAGGGARLSPAGLRRAAGSGLTADEIVQRLEELSAAPVPDEIRDMVQQWAHDWGRGALAQVSVLQMENAEAAAAIATDPKLARYFTLFPGAPVLLLVTGDVTKAKALLTEKGVELQDTFPLR